MYVKFFSGILAATVSTAAVAGIAPYTISTLGLFLGTTDVYAHRH